MFQLTSKGIYAFFEITLLRFPETLEDLPLFVSLAKFKRLLAVISSFYRFFKKSTNPDVIEARYRVNFVALDDTIDARQRDKTFKAFHGLLFQSNNKSLTLNLSNTRSRVIPAKIREHHFLLGLLQGDRVEYKVNLGLGLTCNSSDLNDFIARELI